MHEDPRMRCSRFSSCRRIALVIFRACHIQIHNKRQMLAARTGACKAIALGTILTESQPKTRMHLGTETDDTVDRASYYLSLTHCLTRTVADMNPAKKDTNAVMSNQEAMVTLEVEEPKKSFKAAKPTLAGAWASDERLLKCLKLMPWSFRNSYSSWLGPSKNS